MIKEIKDITFITLVKDNLADSYLLINYLKKNKINFNHIIADGGKKKQETIFKNLKNPLLRYYYFGYDKTYLDLFKKIQKSLQKINTKYVYFLDQGDYLNFNQVIKSAKFLDINKNYSCSIGKVFNFKYLKNRMIIIDQLYTEKKYCKNKIVFKRLIENFHFRSYHALHKTKILKNSISIIVKFKLLEPRTAEFIIDSNNLINGNTHTLENTILLHNATSAKGGGPSLHKKYTTRQIWYGTYFKNKINKILKNLFKLNKLKTNNNELRKIHDLFYKYDILHNSQALLNNNIFKRIKKRINLILFKDNYLKLFLKELNAKL